MPADDLVLNVRQISGYTPTANAPQSSLLLIQTGGLGSAYASISPAALVGTALAQGGDMAISGALSALSISGGRAQFSNGSFGVLGAQSACIGNLTANFGSINGDPILTASELAAFAAQNVRSFNMRFGDIMLTVDDIICAGGAPIFSPAFQGSPRASTPPPWSNSSRIATTAFVQMALANAVDLTGYAPLDSPAFSGVPSAPTAAPGSSDGQLATTAFVMAAVASSVTGVASFNGRTGLVVLTASDVTGVGGALLASPAFAGVPSAPTAAPATSTTQLATTAFVQAAIGAIGTGVASFNGRTGAVTLTAADVEAVGVTGFNGRLGNVFLIANDVSAAGGALLNSPAFSGVPSAPTAIPATNTTQIATTAFVTAAVATATSGVQSFNGRAGVVTLTSADVTGVGGALLANPTFTGTPSAPTAAPATSTAQLATTAFVMAAVSAATAGVSSFNSRTGAVTLIANDVSGAGGALLANPIFTGSPSGPTATPGTNTAQLATCAFVIAAIAALPAGPVASTTAPLMNGTAAPGSSAAWSRGDHVHPTDTSRAAATALANYLPLAGGILAGALSIGGVNISTSGVVTGITNLSNATLGAIGGVVFGGSGNVTNVNDIYPAGDNMQSCGVPGGAWFQVVSYNFIQESDPRAKQDIAFAPPGAVAKVNAVPVHNFRWLQESASAPLHTGWMATEVQAVVGEPSAVVSVGADARNTLGLNLSEMLAILWQAVQELSAQVAVLKDAKT